MLTTPSWLYFVVVSLVFCLHLGSACLNLVGLPGNWLILASSLVFAFLFRTSAGLELGWTGLGILLLLALAGEALEALAGLAGIAKLQASRRSMVLSLFGSLLGSLVGATLGLPIPVVGPAIAAVLGGAMGAFAGAAVGEGWKRGSLGQTWAVGRAAFWGRLLGTFGKFVIGIVMTTLSLIDAVR